MRYESIRKLKKCPVCGSNRLAKILYGRPFFTPKLQDALDSGKIILGGCCVSGDDPKWQCADCGVKIFVKQRTNISRIA